MRELMGDAIRVEMRSIRWTEGYDIIVDLRIAGEIERGVCVCVAPPLAFGAGLICLPRVSICPFWEHKYSF